MVVLATKVTEAVPTTVSATEASAPQLPPSVGRRRTPRTFLPATLALLLAVPLLAAAHQARTAPYGDHLTVRAVHARVEYGTRPPLRTTGGTVEAYDAATGRPRWTYTREGRRPLMVLPARGDAIALWDDGLVTATVRGDGSAVRWHRALPGAAPWLAAHGGTGVLRTLGARMLAVVTPQRIAAYRIADGDLRWVLPAHSGCAFEPARAVRHGSALLIAQPCATTDLWTGEIIAVDELGRITRNRAPLGNERRGEYHSAEHPHTEKVVAPPR
ncbi:PQQ-binding-like beta-propeller repeat protein [Streptomyces sp. NPDC001530]|uniref:outer membrane protein assembly factor BamB family protein n=1 Tax=Streptomyces sp. NPDC001530 TaxID=3364582 RepID=UPI003690039B